MKAGLVLVLMGASHLASALPSLQKRQNIDFDLIDQAPDPKTAPDNSTSYDRTKALAAVVDEIKSDPLPQDQLMKRAIIVQTADGYTENIALGNSAINAPLDCNGKDTYMGAKIFTDGTFDLQKCATACNAQTDYNMRHPPSDGKPKTCQFFNTYSSYKDDVYQGQYCALYTKAWDASYATNKGQYRGSSKYTMQDSYIATNKANSGDVSCPNDIPYLKTAGAAFCTSYINYIAPISTIIQTSSPATVTVTATSTSLTTEIALSVVIQTSVIQTTTYDGDVPLYKKRAAAAIATPASLSTWAASRISAACSAVATGTITTTSTTTLATPTQTNVVTITSTVSTTLLTTSVTTTTALATASACNTFIAQVSAGPLANYYVNGDDYFLALFQDTSKATKFRINPDGSVVDVSTPTSFLNTVLNTDDADSSYVYQNSNAQIAQYKYRKLFCKIQKSYASGTAGAKGLLTCDAGTHAEVFAVEQSDNKLAMFTAANLAGLPSYQAIDLVAIPACASVQAA